MLLGFNPHLHGVWHVCMAALVWCVVLLGLSARLHGDKVKFDITTRAGACGVSGTESIYFELVLYT